MHRGPHGNQSVLAEIDVNGDGTISATEQEACAYRVLRDLPLAVDGTTLSVKLVDWKFGRIADMREGRGEITINGRRRFGVVKVKDHALTSRTDCHRPVMSRSPATSNEAAFAAGRRTPAHARA